MKIIFEYRQVVAAAEKAAAAYQALYDASKQKTIEAYSKPRLKGFPGFRKMYTPMPDEAWKDACSNMYEMSAWERRDFLDNKAACLLIAKKAAQASASMDGNIILESNEIWLLEGYF